MNAKWMCGTAFAALLLLAALPVWSFRTPFEECNDCYNDCDLEYQMCRQDCEDLPPGEITECRAACRQEYIRCNTYCRWEVCNKAS